MHLRMAFEAYSIAVFLFSSKEKKYVVVQRKHTEEWAFITKNIRAVDQ